MSLYPHYNCSLVIHKSCFSAAVLQCCSSAQCFLFLAALRLSWPLSSLSESLLELELSLLLSLACPEPELMSTLSEVRRGSVSNLVTSLYSTVISPAMSANSGSNFLRARYHFLDSFGRPRTVLCQTIGKFVLLAKFWVTAIVVSRLRTTCHHPPGTNIVSPGC